MKHSVTLMFDQTDVPDLQKDEALLRKLAVRQLKAMGISVSDKDVSAFVFRKKSLDARRQHIRTVMRFDVYTDGDVPAEDFSVKAPWKQARQDRRVLIVGDGPAGLFAALRLLEAGIKPVIVERGPEAPQRKRDIADISRRGAVHADSNYCFGEGGAGTFSDGKLFSRSNKRGNIEKILAVFAYHGAPASICTDAHPHIGSDRLPGIIHEMNGTIRKYGGEVRFNTRCIGLLTESAGGVAGAGSGLAAGGAAQADGAPLAGGPAADCAAQAGGAPQADHVAQADGALQADCVAGAGGAPQADHVAQAGSGLRAGGAALAGSGSGAGSAAQAGGKVRITGILAEDTLSGERFKLTGDAVILATGHSAPDMYGQLAAVAPEALEAKTFAAGVRVEHPRTLIDKIQYHGRERGETLPAAEYRLTTQVEGRGVYSFCMCPGGLVVPSASAPGGIVVNGMSPSSRNARWSNAAIVVETRPEDYAEEGAGAAAAEADPLSGLRFREAIERAAYKASHAGMAADTAESAAQAGSAMSGLPAGSAAGSAMSGLPAGSAAGSEAQAGSAAESAACREGVNPQAAPAQRLTDFLEGRLSATLPESSYTPGLVSARLDQVLPEHISSRLKQAFRDFDRCMKGFITEDALLIAPETRTSTPVRILRDKETRESPVLTGLYPAGEGSGYAGGITSSAMDGEATAAMIAEKLTS